MGEVRSIRSAASVRRRGASVREEMVTRAEPLAPRTARRWVMQVAAAAGVGGAANQIAELLTGELVANTVVHGPAGLPVVIRVEVAGSVLRVEVEDRGGGQPVLRRTEPTAAHGRGLALVDALATSWGTTHEGGHTTVWFEVDDA
ncbi:ATP-binding protein [Cellulomonas gelida]|uniref:ATP-binding protein n=1 Tax=Cellulomonas gelida TaxID=1712 RepID=UPI001E64D6D5|nr:ATP-binding protein [Cellulomonas gelida]